jgi:hypothetical protein
MILEPTNAQWKRVQEHYGRPGHKSTRTHKVLDVEHMLPQRFPDYKTIHRRYQ